MFSPAGVYSHEPTGVVLTEFLAALVVATIFAAVLLVLLFLKARPPCRQEEEERYNELRQFHEWQTRQPSASDEEQRDRER